MSIGINIPDDHINTPIKQYIEENQDAIWKDAWEHDPESFDHNSYSIANAYDIGLNRTALKLSPGVKE